MLKENQQKLSEGLSYLDGGKYDKAIAIYKSVVANTPTEWVAFYNMGLAWGKKALTEDIEQEVFRKYSLEGIECYGKAIDLLKILVDKVDKYKNNPQPLCMAYYCRGETHFYLKNVEDAFSDYLQAEKYNRDPDIQEGIYFKRGQMYLWYLDDPDLAIKNLSKAIELAPYAQTYIWRCWAHLDNENADEALKDYRRAKTINPDYVKKSERPMSILKLREWEQFKKEADNIWD